jgi:phosphatidylglycerophosphatase A
MATNKTARWNLPTFVAEGFGVGWIPWAPGTFGSVLGFVWAALLLWPQNPWIFVSGLTGGFAVSVYCCGIAEERLGKTDPGSVVIDEITAIPACLLVWLFLRFQRTGAWPGAADLFADWQTVAGVFLAFRFFDILKPFPVRGSQKLPGGWGVTVDDFLAAVYVNLVFGVWTLLRS